MQNIHQITLDIFKESLKPSITITQNDIDVNKLVVSVTQNKKTFDLARLVPILVCLKPSGKYTMNVMENIDNKLEFTLTQQEVVEAGKVEFAVLLHGVDGSRVSTMKFDVKVLNELVTLETIESQINTEPLLNTLIMQIESKRSIDVKLNESDLSLEVQAKLNNIYDDKELINKIKELESAIELKRDNSIKINKLDLDEELERKIFTMGSDGKSAYQIAQEQGYLGTELEWIESLKGKDGTIGKDGVAGADGKSAYELAVLNGFVGTEASWLLSLKGEKGDQGLQGIRGIDGLSAYNIALSNGFVGTELEWVASLKGDKGDVGPPGVQGLQGPKGDNGADGLSAYEIAVNNGYVGSEQEWISQIDEMKMAIEDLQKNGGTTSIKESINIMLINDTNITAFESLPIVTMQDELKNITLEV